jgi:hypothetical protein
MKPFGMLAIGLAALGATAVQALPVIPGGYGYGMETAAGRGGTVYKVTNLNASGSGSLKACIDGTTARTCVFEVSGVIRLTSDLTIRNSRLTIAGQTAPSPGIMLRGAGIKIQASDILIQHIRVRTGDDPNGPDPDNRDSLKIEGSAAKPVRNIVIDHCSFSWAIDEIASTWGPTDNITFTNNIFAEPLNESIHPAYSGDGVQKRHDGRQSVGAHRRAQSAVARHRIRVREQPGLRPRHDGSRLAEPGQPGDEELGGRQRIPARPQLRARHAADFRAHHRQPDAQAGQPGIHA